MPKIPTMTTKLAFPQESKPERVSSVDAFEHVVLQDEGTQFTQEAAQANLMEEFTPTPVTVGEKVDIDKIEAEEVKQKAKTQEQLHKEEVAFSIKAGRIPVSQIPPQDLDNFMAESIVARPLRLPTMLDVRAKDPNYRLRWVFKGKDGMRYNDMLAAGFVKASTEDVVGLSSEVMIKPEGITYNDVILMKIPTAILFGWYKHNALRSMRTVSNKGAHAVAKQQSDVMIRDGIRSEYGSGQQAITQKGWTQDEVSRSVTAYIPGEKDFERIENMK